MTERPSRRSRGERIFTAVIGFVFAFQFAIALSYPPDPRLFPLIVAGAGMLLAGAMEFGLGLGEETGEKLDSMSRRLLTLALVTPPLYALALWLVGYWVATIVAIPAIAVLLGYRRPIVIALVTAGVALAIGLLLPLVNVGLPKAALFGRHFVF